MRAADALIEALLHEGCEVAFGLPGGALDDRNFRVKRLIKLGFDMNGAEAQRERVGCTQPERDRERQQQRSFHLGMPPEA